MSTRPRSGSKPPDIPAQPDRTYAEDGWAGWGDWLGTDTVASHLREYRPFKKARAFINALGLNSLNEWQAYCRSGKKPVDIPSNANLVYGKDGWDGWGDWLGSGK